MTDSNSGMRQPIDVAIIGGGPAGLAAAVELKRRGIARVIILEREPEAGGIPRHCGHFAFGMREFKRVLRGPVYAGKLVAAAREAGVETHTATTVVEARPGGELLTTSDRGPVKLSARRVIYATGVRETPRSARLISGNRPQGVINTGALQSMIYLQGLKPFEHPVIVGTELVSISAILTCRHAGIHPVAMLEQNNRVTARWPSSLFPPLTGIPLHLGTRVIAIEGGSHPNAVLVEQADGNRHRIGCDGVILSGRFTPEASLALCGHLAVDPKSRGPEVDQYGRCSDPAYFASGNILRPVETAGWSWNEGRQTGRWVADDLAGVLPAQGAQLRIVTHGPLIRFSMPQKILLPHTDLGMKNLQLRFSHTATGYLEVHGNKGIVWQRKLRVLPERRVLVPLKDLIKNTHDERIELHFRERPQ